MRRLACLSILLIATSALARGEAGSALNTEHAALRTPGLSVVEGPHPALVQSAPEAAYDHMLDTYVRDGLVYYRAVQSDRGALERFIASLDVPRATIDSWPKPQQQAFWINGYNAFVLQTVIEHYPIKTVTAEFPEGSIRQIPGSFEQIKHRIGGQSLTLDGIEKGPVLAFGDARMIFALARAARGSGRLRSEVYRAEVLEKQLDEALNEFVTRPTCFKVDREHKIVEVSPLISWREAAIIESFEPAGSRWTTRSPIERAMLGMAFPHLFADERQMLSEDVFQVKYGTFNWELNEVTPRTP